MPPLAELLIVETNFLLASAFGEGRGVDAVRRAAENGLVRLLLPEASVTEVVKAWEQRRRGWADLLNRLQDCRNKVAGSAGLQEFEGDISRAGRAVADLLDRAEELVWEALLDLVAKSERIETDIDVLRLARDGRDLLNLSPGDALVLGAARVAAERRSARVFLSTDHDLSRPAVREYLAAQGLTVHRDGFAALRALGVEPRAP